MQLAVTLTLWPLLLFLDLPVSALAPLVNLVLVPLFGVVIVPLALLGGLLVPFSPQLSGGLLRPLDGLAADPGPGPGAVLILVPLLPRRTIREAPGKPATFTYFAAIGLETFRFRVGSAPVQLGAEDVLVIAAQHRRLHRALDPGQLVTLGLLDAPVVVGTVGYARDVVRAARVEQVELGLVALAGQHAQRRGGTS